MRIYMLNDYDEHGPENIRVSATPDGIRAAFKARLDADWPVHRAIKGYREETAVRLEELLAINEPCSWDLGSGWGGLQFHILETVD